MMSAMRIKPARRKDAVDVSSSSSELISQTEGSMMRLAALAESSDCSALEP
jgi:hypothetical protein